MRVLRVEGGNGMITREQFKSWVKDIAPPISEYQTLEATQILEAIADFLYDLYSNTGKVTETFALDDDSIDLIPYVIRTFGGSYRAAQKIGFGQSGLAYDQYDDYNIFERISRGIASNAEKQQLKAYVFGLAHQFRIKGTPGSINRAFKNFNFTSNVKDLWTDSWGFEERDALIDIFDTSLVHSVSQLNQYVRTPETVEYNPNDSGNIYVDDDDNKLVISAPDTILVVAQRPSEVGNSFNDAECLIQLDIDSSSNTKNFAFIFRGNKRTDSTTYDIDDYYFVGLGMFGFAMVIGKFTYNSNFDEYYYSIIDYLTDGDEVVMDGKIPTDIPMELSINIAGSIVQSSLSVAGITTLAMTTDLNVVDTGTNIEKFHYDGTAFPTNRRYDYYNIGGAYGFRVKDAIVNVKYLSVRPQGRAEPNYFTESDYRNSVKSKISERYGAPEISYNNALSKTYDVSDLNFFTATHELNSTSCATSAYILKRNSSLIISADDDTNTIVVSDLGTLSSDESAFLISDFEIPAYMEMTFSFINNESDPKVGIALAAPKFDKCMGEWHYNGTFLSYETNRIGYDVVLYKYSRESSENSKSFLGGANIINHIVAGTSYDIKLSYASGVFYLYIRESDSSSWTPIIVYDSTSTSSTSRGILLGIPPILADVWNYERNVHSTILNEPLPEISSLRIGFSFGDLGTTISDVAINGTII